MHGAAFLPDENVANLILLEDLVVDRQDGTARIAEYVLDALVGEGASPETRQKFRKMLREGDPNGTVWRPGETDVSIRPGWFYHPAEDARVRSVDNLVNLFFTSVGRNSKLLLNVPPTRDGLIHAVDAERLAGMRTRLREMQLTDAPNSANALSGTHSIEPRC